VHSLGTELNGLEDYLNDYGVYADVYIVFDEEELSDSDDIEDVPENTNHHTRRNDLTLTQRKEVYEALLQSSNNGKLKKGQHNCSWKHVQCQPLNSAACLA
jgi:hypothetical protein